MNKTILLLILAVGVIIVVGILALSLTKPKNSLSTPSTSQSKQSEKKVEIVPSKTLKSFADPSGFVFNYPDNLSLVNNQPDNANTYANIQLTAKGVAGSLNLKIADSQFTNINEWLKNTAKATPKEVSLGNLKALEIESRDKLLLGALDSGVLFTLDIPLKEDKGFWMKVYQTVAKDFSFVQASKESSADEVTFEGEESVE